MKIVISAVLAALCLFGAPAHAAALLKYELSGSASQPVRVWYLPQQPTPDSTANGTSFQVHDIETEEDGVTILRSFHFSTIGGLRVLEAGNEDTILLNIQRSSNPRLFSSPLGAPTLLTGSFTLFTGPGVSPSGSYDLVVSLVPESVVPEPQTWALMLVGFGAIGGAARIAKRRTMPANA